jgi:hypothetical protein
VPHFSTKLRPPSSPLSLSTIKCDIVFYSKTQQYATSSAKKPRRTFILPPHQPFLTNLPSPSPSFTPGQIHVRNPTILGQSVLHKYFRHSKYSSFQRQLNYFGFRKTQGKGKMSACTYTNVQLSGGNIKSLLNVKRKSSTGTGGKGEGEGGEEDLLLLAEELEEGTDSDEDSSEGYTPVTAVSLGQKRGASLSFSASSALSMSSISTGSSMRKRVRSSSSSSSLSLGGGGGGVSLEESLAADECLDGEEEEGGEGEEEEGSEGNTSAGAHSGYSSSLGDEEEDEDDDDDEDDYDEDEDEEEDDTHHSFPSSHAANHRQSHLHLPPHQQQQQHQLQLGRGGPPRLTFTLSGGIRTSHPTSTSSSLPSSSTTITTLPTSTTVTTTTSSSSSTAGAKPLDLNALPNFFSYNVLPAPSPRGADDLFPSCLASFDPLGESASSPCAWVEPPISGSLSSLSLETGCGMTPLGTLDEGNSNHSAFARDDEKGWREREREVMVAAMPSAAAIAAAALCSPRGESAFLLSVEGGGGGGGGGGGDFWGAKASS